ncbi:hypothetical protein [Sulfurospirillum cavolei]|uniref:hypothetical protein n=1 Tax=Sulfurospirillum cavolei TaxID=366522 RepID=UPI000A74433A|nr:hypothetical protein [Sulfurospirillum cavolei]
MKYLSSFIISFFVLILFSACSSKDMKQFGGNLAVANNSGEPISTVVTVATGGIIYGIGALSETQEEKEAEEKRKSAKPLFPEEPFDENNPVIIDTLKVQVSDVKYEVVQESNTTLNQE